MSASGSRPQSQSGSPPSSPTPRVSGQWSFRPPSFEIHRKSKAGSQSSSGSPAESGEAVEDRPQIWPSANMLMLDAGRSRSSKKSSKSADPKSAERRSRSHSRPRSFMLGRKSFSTHAEDGSSSTPTSPDSTAFHASAKHLDEFKELQASRARVSESSRDLADENDLQKLMSMNNRGRMTQQQASGNNRMTSDEREIQKLMDMNNRRSMTEQRAPSKMSGNEPQRMPSITGEENPGLLPDLKDTSHRVSFTARFSEDPVQELDTSVSLRVSSPPPRKPSFMSRLSTSSRDGDGPISPNRKNRGPESFSSASNDADLQKLMDMNNRGSLTQQRVTADIQQISDHKELQRLMDLNNRGSLSDQRMTMDVGASSPKQRRSLASSPTSPVGGPHDTIVSPLQRVKVIEPVGQATESDLLKLMEMNNRGSMTEQRVVADIRGRADEKELQRLVDMNNRGSLSSQRSSLEPSSKPRRISVEPSSPSASAPTSPSVADPSKYKALQIKLSDSTSSVDVEIDKLMDMNNRGSLTAQRAGVEVRSSSRERDIEKVVEKMNKGNLSGQRAFVEPVITSSQEAQNDFEKMMEMNNRRSLGVQRASISTKPRSGASSPNTEVSRSARTSSATSPLPAESPSTPAIPESSELISPVSELRNTILQDMQAISVPPSAPEVAPSTPSQIRPSLIDPTASPKSIRTPPRSPYLLPGESRAEKIAQLVRQHKESSKDPITGHTIIPKRTASYGIEVEGANSARSSLEGGATKSHVPSVIGSEQSTSVSQPGSLLPSPTLSLPPGDFINHQEDEAGGSGLPPSGSFYKTMLGAREIPTPLIMPTGTVSLDSSPVKEAEDFDYKTLEPADIATRLFNLTLPGIGKDKVCQIIGKGDEFHTSVLNQYMELYEFYGMSLDAAFRHLCAHLHLNGETQQVDRILYRFSRRFWDCNVDAQATYRSIDIVYGILFSLVLLNTDLHIANVGSSGRKMQRKTFVKNTSDLIDKMISDDGTVKEDFASLGAEGMKKWKKDIENMLKDLYTSVKDNRILQRPGDPDVRSASPDPYQSYGTSTLLRRSNSVGKRSSGILKNSRSAFLPTSSSVISTSGGLMNSPTSFFRPSAFASNNDRRPSDNIQSSTDSLAKDSRYSLGSHGSFGSGQILSSADNSLSSISNFPLSSSAPDSSKTTPTSAVASSLGSPVTAAGNRRPSFSSENSGNGFAGLGFNGAAGGSTLFNGREGVTLEGLLVRKHLTDHNETRARNRRWVKVWCVMAIDDDRGVELTMFKVDPGVGDGEINFDDRELADYGKPMSEEESTGSQDLERRSTDFTTKKLLRIANQAPVVFNLLHSLATPLKAPGYSPSRPYVFNLLLNNNSSHLFQCPSPEAIVEWTRTLNYWAARRSKEPLRGAISSAEYGWNFAAEERRKKERQEKEGISGAVGGVAEKSGAGSSFSASGEMGSGSLDGGERGWGKKSKIEDWMPPTGTGMVVSALTEELQLTSMRRQVDALSKEIEEHASYKKPMERQYAFNLALKAKALANWHRKQKYLTLEYDRFSTYVQTLRTSVTDKQRRMLDDATDVGAGAMSDGEGYASRTARSARSRVRKARTSFSTVDSVSSAEDGPITLSGVRE